MTGVWGVRWRRLRFLLVSYAGLAPFLAFAPLEDVVKTA